MHSVQLAYVRRNNKTKAIYSGSADAWSYKTKIIENDILGCWRNSQKYWKYDITISRIANKNVSKCFSKTEERCFAIFWNVVAYTPGSKENGAAF